MCTAGLPHELAVEILSRLPVKPLLRFRCVSKSWRSLIDSSSFVRLHLLKNQNSRLYLLRINGDGRDPEVRSSFVEVDLLKCGDRLPVESFIIPTRIIPRHMRFVGVCDGLICFSSHFLHEIVLVNLSTREYRKLPSAGNIGGGSWDVGLGYDSFADEYKVVLLQGGSEAKVYGSKSNTWRQINVCSANRGPFWGKYSHGSLHWIAREAEPFSSKMSRFSIVAFDLVTEKFTVAEYGKDLFGNPEYVFLLVVGGRLCLCCRHNVEKGTEGYMDVWVMEEYGVRGSWSKLVSFDRYVTPLAFSNCGRRLLFSEFQDRPCGWHLHWYDVDKKSKELTNSLVEFYEEVCPQTLVRLENKFP